MLNNFTKLIYFFLYIIDRFLRLFAKRFEFLLHLKEYIENRSYKQIDLLGKKINFFIPNKAVKLILKSQERLNGLIILKIIKIQYFGILDQI